MAPPAMPPSSRPKKPSPSASAPFAARNIVGVTLRPMPAASRRAAIASIVRRGFRRSTICASEPRRRARDALVEAQPLETEIAERIRPYSAALRIARWRSLDGWVTTSPARYTAAASMRTASARSMVISP